MNRISNRKSVSKLNRLALKTRKPYAPVEKVFMSKKIYERKIKHKNNIFRDGVVRWH